MACHVDREELAIRMQLWAQGMSIREMAEERFVTHKTMQRYVCRHRKFFPRRHRASTAEEREKARAMRAEGMTYKAIAETLGRNKNAVWHWCNDRRM